MPYIAEDNYQKPWYYFNEHVETIIPSVRNKAPEVSYSRERLELSDGDFLDLDWLKSGKNRLMIITHGFEGNSARHYVRRPASYFFQRSWDVCAWNCRSCSGEMNRLTRFYHHGATEDLEAVIDHAIESGYESIVLMGLSMGGSMSLKYLGETQRPSDVKGAVTFSVPCNLTDSAVALARPKNRFYENRFLKKLKKKIIIKSEMHEDIDVDRLDEVKRFEQFHRRYSVPLHGFSSLEEFYQKATCDQFFDGIKVPVLIGNALNDPLLEGGCFPIATAQRSSSIHLKTPKFGGHVGFTIPGQHFTWIELEAEKFVKEQLGLV